MDAPRARRPDGNDDGRDVRTGLWRWRQERVMKTVTLTAATRRQDGDDDDRKRPQDDNSDGWNAASERQNEIQYLIAERLNI